MIRCLWGHNPLPSWKNLVEAQTQQLPLSQCLCLWQWQKCLILSVNWTKSCKEPLFITSTSDYVLSLAKFLFLHRDECDQNVQMLTVWNIFVPLWNQIWEKYVYKKHLTRISLRNIGCSYLTLFFKSYALNTNFRHFLLIFSVKKGHIGRTSRPGKRTNNTSRKTWNKGFSKWVPTSQSIALERTVAPLKHAK